MFCCLLFFCKELLVAVVGWECSSSARMEGCWPEDLLMCLFPNSVRENKLQEELSEPRSRFGFICFSVESSESFLALTTRGHMHLV